MTAPMNREYRKLAHRLVGLETRVNALSGPRLAYSSLEDGAIGEYDANGQLVSIIGRQFDGTHGAFTVAGPVPPTPSDLTATAVQGGVELEWSGEFTDAISAPMDWSRLEIHGATHSGLSGVVRETLLTTISSPRGGKVFIPVPNGQVRYFRSIARSLAGKIGVPSQVIGPIGPGISTDSTIPNPPSSLVLTTTSGLDSAGRDASTLTATWAAPTQNTDGSSLTDLSAYRVRWRWTARANWSYASTEQRDIDIAVSPGLPYELQVATLDTGGNISTYAAAGPITSAKDSTAPDAPSDPLVSNYLGQLRIEWNGLSSTGTAMPSDLNRVDVHVGTTAGFTFSDATKIASLSTKGVAFATAPYGSARWVRLVAYDHQGNVGSPSAAVSGTTGQVVSADVFDGAIGTAKLAELAVTNAKIALLAVNDANIANLSVGKLATGIMTAEVTIAGRFATALTGARTELNAVGIQAWNAAGTKTIDLNGSSNLLTGTLKTAETGRRIVIGASGAVGEMSFYAPDGTYGMLKSYTESGGVEAIQLGIPITGTDTLWNRINYNSDQWANYRALKHEFHYVDNFQVRKMASNAPGASSVYRLVLTSQNFEANVGTDGAYVFNTIDNGGLTRPRMKIGGDIDTAGQGNIEFVIEPTGHDFRVLRRQGGTSVYHFRHRITDTEVLWQWPSVGNRVAFQPRESVALSAFDNTSPGLQLVNHHNYGAVIRYLSTSSGGSQRVEVNGVLGEGSFAPLWASGFVQQSARASKDEIVDMAESGMSELANLTPKRYRRKMVGPKGAAELGPVELGFVAEEVPACARITTEDGASGPGYSIPAMLALQVSALRELNDRLTALERGRP